MSARATSTPKQPKQPKSARKATSRIFRTRLRKARAEKGMSQAALALAAGLQQSALSHYENGTRRPSFTNLRRLADALEVSTDFLVGQGPAPAEPRDDLARRIAKLRPADRELVRSLVDSLSRRAR